jgi:hypothetical protein
VRGWSRPGVMDVRCRETSNFLRLVGTKEYETLYIGIQFEMHLGHRGRLVAAYCAILAGLRSVILCFRCRLRCSQAVAVPNSGTGGLDV